MLVQKMADERQVVVQPRTATLHRELVHESALTPQLKAAMASLLTPYASVTEAAPSIRDLYLAPNVGVADDGRLTGYVATVAGNAAAVVSESLGTGRTWFRVVARDGARIDDEQLERSFAPVGEGYTTPGMLVAVVSGIEYPSRVHYIVVEGNDREAARSLVAAARKSHASLDDVVSGALADTYTAVVKRSHEARQKTAVEFLRAHDLELDEKATEGNMVIDFITHSEALSEVARSSRAAAKNVYLVYSGVADPSSASGGVMVYRGPIAGFTLHAGPLKTVKGRASVAYSNAELSDARAHRPFSMWPADTGRYLGEHTRRAADRHKYTSEAITEVHGRRVKWSGAVRSYNPRSELVLHAPNDTHLIDTFTRLGAPPGGAVTSQLLDVVVCELPAMDTRSMSLPELVHVAAKATETHLPVLTSSLITMLNAYPKAASLPLAKVFAQQQEDATVVDKALLCDMAACSSSS